MRSRVKIFNWKDKKELHLKGSADKSREKLYPVKRLGQRLQCVGFNDAWSLRKKVTGEDTNGKKVKAMIQYSFDIWIHVPHAKPYG